MLNEEKIVRDVLAMWAHGLESTKDSWRQHCSDNVIWWNSARGAIEGLSKCLEGIDTMFDVLGVESVQVPIRTLLAAPGVVVVERSDDLYRKDGTIIQHAPVTGVVEFEGDTIVCWRDYCDDWMLKLQQGNGDPSPSYAP
ncbi:limonene-1,2-epoxide hydrolase family protein [Rhodococcus opacus]|jgi:limonene-1,2-epoxide hydrolase|uniref:limonene-1,2-epoxide hydrolase family protein n=1 Tax=Rhodococcus opacus TaxID=37919 RepID=UPI002474CA00|nr:limonene-1,2-epoxide hydrolase family protein [Rhodococcus opacus]MDH6291237.1 limonene-1,2-epoxide hydrolase [Rhodococcus opacus]